MKIHHIGYTVRDIKKASDTFSELGFRVSSEECFDEFRKVRILFMENGETTIELVAPASPDSPVTQLLKREGPTPYHICYETQDVDSVILDLKKKGFIQLQKNVEIAPAIPGGKVIFLTSLSTGLIELLTF